MNSKQEFVGSVRIKPAVQEAMKTMCGGMIAASTAILFYWMQSDRPLPFIALVMLIALVVAIPILASARVLYASFDNYERVSAEIENRLTNLFASGMALSVMGYGYSIYVYNKILAAAFLIGVGVCVYHVVRLGKEIDSAHNIRRS